MNERTGDLAHRKASIVKRLGGGKTELSLTVATWTKAALPSRLSVIRALA